MSNRVLAFWPNDTEYRVAALSMDDLLKHGSQMVNAVPHIKIPYPHAMLSMQPSMAWSATGKYIFVTVNKIMVVHNSDLVAHKVSLITIMDIRDMLTRPHPYHDDMCIINGSVMRINYDRMTHAPMMLNRALELGIFVPVTTISNLWTWRLAEWRPWKGPPQYMTVQDDGATLELHMRDNHTRLFRVGCNHDERVGNFLWNPSHPNLIAVVISSRRDPFMRRHRTVVLNVTNHKFKEMAQRSAVSWCTIPGLTLRMVWSDSLWIPKIFWDTVGCRYIKMASRTDWHVTNMFAHANCNIIAVALSRMGVPTCVQSRILEFTLPADMW